MRRASQSRKPHGHRTLAPASAWTPPPPNFLPAKWPPASHTKQFKSTAATVTAANIPSNATTATPASPKFTKAPAKSSASSSPPGSSGRESCVFLFSRSSSRLNSLQAIAPRLTQRSVKGFYRNPAEGYAIRIPNRVQPVAGCQAGPERGVSIQLESRNTILTIGEPNNAEYKDPKEAIGGKVSNLKIAGHLKQLSPRQGWAKSPEQRAGSRVVTASI